MIVGNMDLKIRHWGLFYIHGSESELLGTFVLLVMWSRADTNLLSNLIDPVGGAVA